MNIDYVDKRYRALFNPQKVVNPSRFYKIKNLLLAGAKKSILKGFKVEIVTQKQLESLPVSISWSFGLATWLISCSSASFTVDDKDDFRNNEVEPALRSACKQLTEKWFEIIDRIQANGKLDDFKKELAEKTLVGSWVSKSSEGQILEYNSNNLVFNTIVKNASV